MQPDLQLIACRSSGRGVIAAGGLGEAYTHTAAPRLASAWVLSWAGSALTRGAGAPGQVQAKKNGAGCPTPLRYVLPTAYRLG